MSHEFINPNLHVVLVHYPIALLVLGTLIELLSFLWRRSGLGAAGRWMILLGALSSIPTATSGIYAARDVMSDESDLQYHDLARASKLSDAQHEFLEHHIWYNGSATVLSVLVVVTWLGSSDRTRSRLHIPLLLLLVIACGLVAVGAWHGGEMVYRYATGVERAPALAEAHPTGEKVEEQYPGQERVEYIFPPMQIHVIGAGIVVAMAMGSMGLSLRAASVARERDRLREEARDADEDALARQPDDVASLHRTLSGDTHAPDALGAPVGVPSTRFWLLTSLLALFTATGGAYVLATSVHTWNPSELWEYVTSPDMPRRLSHVGVGGGIVLTSLILAGLSRWAPRSTLSLALFSTLLIALIAAQVWVGVLMMYDTAQGSVTGFNPDVGTPTPRVASTTAPTTTTAPVAP